MKDIKHTIHLQSGCYPAGGCEFCGERIYYPTGNNRLDKAINHYISKHGYKLLHVGAYTDEDMDGKPWHGTTAILGSEVVLPEREIGSDLPTEEEFFGKKE